MNASISLHLVTSDHNSEQQFGTSIHFQLAAQRVINKDERATLYDLSICAKIFQRTISERRTLYTMVSTSTYMIQVQRRLIDASEIAILRIPSVVPVPLRHYLTNLIHTGSGGTSNMIDQKSSTLYTS